MNKNNYVRLHGFMHGEPVLSHTTCGMSFYSGYIRIPRTSGANDILPVLFRDAKPEGVTNGTELTLEGELRSYNNRSGFGRKLILNVLVDNWVIESGDPENEVRLSCVLCRAPAIRHTPLGKTICDLLAASRRATGRSDYLPLIAWGRVAYSMSGKTAGSAFTCVGRFQSREYRKTLPDGSVENRVAYEVSIAKLEEDHAEST